VEKDCVAKGAGGVQGWVLCGVRSVRGGLRAERIGGEGRVDRTGFASVGVAPPGASSRNETPAEPEAAPASGTTHSSSSPTQATPSSANPPPNLMPDGNTPARAMAKPAGRSSGGSFALGARVLANGSFVRSLSRAGRRGARRHGQPRDVTTPAVKRWFAVGRGTACSSRRRARAGCTTSSGSSPRSRRSGSAAACSARWVRWSGRSGATSTRTTRTPSRSTGPPTPTPSSAASRTSVWILQTRGTSWSYKEAGAIATLLLPDHPDSREGQDALPLQAWETWPCRLE